MRCSILILALSLAACEGATDTGPNDDSLGRLLTAEQPSITVTREYFSGITRPTDLLITTQADWARVWAEIYSNRTPAPVRPEINFAREALILSALGTSPGINNVIEGVRIFERGVVVRVVRERYSERCLVLTAVGQPVHVVRIQKPQGDVVRVESRESVISCE
ncbi:MAG TPA: hypothetical protein VJU15_13140 [Gemmatimonadales bacterium]|nr:hypothetical protein [Gemmatimonadales bacterium]